MKIHKVQYLWMLVVGLLVTSELFSMNNKRGFLGLPEGFLFNENDIGATGNDDENRGDVKRVKIEELVVGNAFVHPAFEERAVVIAPGNTNFVINESDAGRIRVAREYMRRELFWRKELPDIMYFNDMQLVKTLVLLLTNRVKKFLNMEALDQVLYGKMLQVVWLYTENRHCRYLLATIPEYKQEIIALFREKLANGMFIYNLLKKMHIPVNRQLRQVDIETLYRVGLLAKKRVFWKEFTKSEEFDYGAWRCTICLEDAPTQSTFPRWMTKASVCGHYYCSECLESSLTANVACPLCRKPVDGASDEAPERIFS
jgi:hypothetical protein